MSVEEAVFDLGRDSASVGQARQEARAVLKRWSVPVDIDLTVLLVSEVVTNAVLHGDPPVRLRLEWDDPTLRVSVCDTDVERVPVRLDAAANADSGRGIALVDAIAPRWGVEVTDAEKIVWFEMD